MFYAHCRNMWWIEIHDFQFQLIQKIQNLPPYYFSSSHHDGSHVQLLDVQSSSHKALLFLFREKQCRTITRIQDEQP